MDSLFRDYPIPPIFLHKKTIVGGLSGAVDKFEIVDGQQRILALHEYHKGNFPLLRATDKKLKIPNTLRGDVSWGGLRFSELNETDRAKFLDCQVDVFEIVDVKKEDEIRDLFIRLQSGTALTRQQVRDAWPGPIGPFIENLAGKISRSPSLSLFRLVDKRGGNKGEEENVDEFDEDRQFCAQLLALYLKREIDPRSVPSIGAPELDKLYHETTDFDGSGPTAIRFVEALRLATRVFEAAFEHSGAVQSSETGTSKKKLRKLQIISTIFLIQDLQRNTHVKLDENFFRRLGSHLCNDKGHASSGRTTSGPKILNYYLEWRDRLPDELVTRLDPKRAFDFEQKRAMFERQHGSCNICALPLELEKAEGDHHPIPHRLGGKTELENGRLVHEECHPRGRPSRQSL